MPRRQFRQSVAALEAGPPEEFVLIPLTWPAGVPSVQYVYAPAGTVLEARGLHAVVYKAVTVGAAWVGFSLGYLLSPQMITDGSTAGILLGGFVEYWVGQWAGTAGSAFYPAAAGVWPLLQMWSVASPTLGLRVEAYTNTAACLSGDAELLFLRRTVA